MARGCLAMRSAWVVSVGLPKWETASHAGDEPGRGRHLAVIKPRTPIIAHSMGCASDWPLESGSPPLDVGAGLLGETQ